MSIWSIAWLILLSLLFLALLLGLAWWLRREADPARRSFHGAVRRFEREVGVEGRYQLPWVLALGERARTAETLCAALQLKCDGEANWFGRWWYGVDGALLVAPEDMFAHPEGALTPLSAWRRLLGALLRMRANRPLDALIWVVAADKLWSESMSVSAGLAASRKFADMQQRLGLSLPIYIVVTGAELVPGFVELAQAMPGEARDAMLGWSSPYPASVAYQSEWIEEALDKVRWTVEETVAEIGALQGRLPGDLYLLPRRLSEVCGNLQALCDPVFRGNALGEAPSLRGIYFTGALAREDEECAPAPFFAGRLLRQRVLAEQGLAQPVPRILRLRRRWQRWTLAGAALVSVLWLAGMGWFWHQAVGRIEQLTEQRQTFGLDGGATSAADGEAMAAQRIRVLWQALEQMPARRFATLLFPSSLLSSMDERLEATLRHAMRTIVMRPAQQRLLQNAGELARIEDEDGSDVDQEGYPETWPEYMLAKQLVDEAAMLEQQVGRFNRAARNPGAVADEAQGLANALFELDLRPLPAAARDNLGRALADGEAPLIEPIGLSKIRPVVTAHFAALMNSWYGKLYTSQNFRNDIGLVEQQLQLLDNRQLDSADKLKRLTASIDRLQRLTASINSAWGRASGHDLVPGYSAMLEKAARSGLIGVDAVSRVEDSGVAARQGFHKHWLSESAPESSLLTQQAAGGLELQKPLLQLKAGLDAFLAQPFSAGADAVAGLSGMDAARLAAALRDYADYQKFLGGAGLPVEHRGAAMAAMNAVVARGMRSELARRTVAVAAGAGGARPDSGFEAMSRDMPSLLAAFDDLGQPDIGEETARAMDLRALASLRQAERQLQSLEAYRPTQGGFGWWDGSRNAGFRAFRAANAGELKQYLGGQLEQVAALAQGQTAGLAWLGPRQALQSVDDQALIQRWLGMAAELRRYREKAVDSAPALLEALIGHDLNEMDSANCRSVLDQAARPAGGTFFADRAQALLKMADKRCDALRLQGGADAYRRLARHFNQYLANRFPFAADIDAADASPERVAEFMRLIDDNAALAAAGLQDMKSARAPAARRFVDSIRAARAWLGPLFVRDNGGPWQGVDVNVSWRTDRDKEKGADQVIEWTLAGTGQKIAYPGGAVSRWHWSVGQPAALTLRWAKDAPQSPADDPQQPGLSVFDRLASWSYDGQWALLRLMRANQAGAQLGVAGESGDIPLLLSLPVRNPASGGSAVARMFVRLSLTAPGGKSGLEARSLPYLAPPSPFDRAAGPETSLTAQNGN
ncbi:type VI secretion system protein [Chromobacterium vaccinii]|uniref:Type VI secretion system protein n=1 Tax=Chromobacterium vaccinii TaxID=1108595 RepID=A0ABV0FFI9_9NEIS